MFDGPYALALAAGMAATVNPCGFALLPAYLSAFLGTENTTGGTKAVGRALAVSAALTGGFVVVFATFGLIVTPLALSVEEHLPWLTIVIGLSLVALGAALVLGKSLTLAIPKFQKGGRDGTLPSMFLFGVSYALASLSCTIGPFLAVTTTTFRSSSWVAGSGVFLAYAIGMGAVITVLTVALSLAKASAVRRLRSALPVINRVAGVLMVLAGAYVAYYGWYEIRLSKGFVEDPVVDRATRMQEWLQNRIVPDNPTRAVVTVAVVLGAIVLAMKARQRWGPRSRSAPAVLATADTATAAANPRSSGPAADGT